MKLKPLDIQLQHLARLAGVRPPHVWHLYSALLVSKGELALAAYSTFSGLELRHVERIVSVLESEGIYKRTIVEKQASMRGSRLQPDFKVPDEWIGWAITQRRWTRDVAETVAAEFCDYWPAQPGQKGVKTDWLATWRNWVRRSYSPDGEPVAAKADPEALKELCRRGIEVESARGNRIAVERWRRQLESL